MQTARQEPGSTPIVGRHVYGEVYGVNEETLSNEELLRKIVAKAAELANMHLVEVNSWRFKGGDKEGVSVIALVLESHIAVHTWPFYNYATIDVYTCGERSDPMAAFRYIINQLKPKRYTINYSDRSYKNSL
ncbi:MAG: adenosylmethionine decarboxylase [Thermoproteus sp.]|nr:adenosylmethionine decarboxylase [Thermoproteus sp.]